MDITQLRSEFSDPHHLIQSLDGQTLFLREWPTEEKSDICALILHGITAYSGPYSILGKPISQAGYHCYGLDLRGHGLSDGIRGDYPSRETLVEDLRATLDFLKKRHTKVIIIGHSLGVVTGSIMLIHMQDDIDGVVFLSAARTFKNTFRKRSIVSTLKILWSSITNPSRPVIHYYRDGMVGLDDPLFNFYYTLRFMRTLDPKKLRLPDKLDVPVYIAVGDEDELFDVNAVEAFADEINAADKEMYVIPGAKHAIFPDGSWNHLIQWMEQKFPR